MTVKTNIKLAQDCPICGGTGWVSYDVPIGHPHFGKVFRCDSDYHSDPERAKADALRASQGLAHLVHMTFENFDPQGHASNDEQRASLQTAYDWAKKYANEPRGWLFISGGYGVGKTHLAAAIANTRLQQGLPVVFFNAPDLLDQLRAAYNPDADATYSERFDELRNAALLILDDLGTQNATAWADEKLFQLLNHRYVAQLPTVITSNLPLDDLDARLSSRLADMDLVRKLPIAAPDYRRSALEQDQSSLSHLVHYYDKTFESFDLRAGELKLEERRNLEEALTYTRIYAESPQGWLAIFGAYGSGKTHLAAAIANRRAAKGYATLFVVVPDLLDHLRAAFSPQSGVTFDQRFEEVRSAALLILDDLGTESATPWAREKLYQIVNHRHTAHLPTVITTSLAPDELDPRIRSRILDETSCRLISILAPNYRGRNLATRAQEGKRAPSSRKRQRT